MNIRRQAGMTSLEFGLAGWSFLLTVLFLIGFSYMAYVASVVNYVATAAARDSKDYPNVLMKPDYYKNRFDDMKSKYGLAMHLVDTTHNKEHPENDALQVDVKLFTSPKDVNNYIEGEGHYVAPLIYNARLALFTVSYRISPIVLSNYAITIHRSVLTYLE
ncbi:TadE family protein [Dongshaea marina]|uniref:TadE family protein n=1 Tax=Dongshaea marina TaxID=2047966 RepID=UPI000D3E4E46|nr:TadE family protein [Dongshaea marina]